MFLLYDADPAVLNRKLEHRYPLVVHKLGRDRAAHQFRISFGAPSQILLGLHDRKLIPAALCLNRNDIMDAVAIKSDIDFVDLDLTFRAWSGNSGRGPSDAGVTVSVI